MNFRSRKSTLGFELQNQVLQDQIMRNDLFYLRSLRKINARQSQEIEGQQNFLAHQCRTVENGLSRDNPGQHNRQPNKS